MNEEKISIEQKLDDDYVLVDESSFSNREMLLLQDAFIMSSDPCSGGQRYSHFHLNNLLNLILDNEIKNQKAIACETIYFEERNFIRLFEMNQRKVALFMTVTDDPPGIDRSSQFHFTETLETALKIYHNYLNDHPDMLPATQCIIPVAEIVRGHFRLLVIDQGNNQAHFYDSKSFLVSHLYEFLSSVKASHGSINAFTENYYYVSSTCEKYFPSITFQNCAFGHQWLCNDYDCGPLVAAYTALAIEGKTPPEVMKILSIEDHGKELFFYRQTLAETDETEVSNSPAYTP
ncbi:MAG: hypothetical protein SFW66_04330 [Gammaproteobacteria bacterium]|nr:hypothetical protein [Gammaproteobacteria bacterium]